MITVEVQSVLTRSEHFVKQGKQNLIKHHFNLILLVIITHTKKGLKRVNKYYYHYWSFGLYMKCATNHRFIHTIWTMAFLAIHCRECCNGLLKNKTCCGYKMIQLKEIKSWAVTGCLLTNHQLSETLTKISCFWSAMVSVFWELKIKIILCFRSQSNLNYWQLRLLDLRKD